MAPGCGTVAGVSSLAARCDVQFSDPLSIPTAWSMTLYLAISKRGRGDVGCTWAVYLQCAHVTRGASEACRTWSTAENTVVAGGPQLYEEKIDFAKIKKDKPIWKQYFVSFFRMR